MIYSNEHDFLIIATPKTGSTSVAAYFADSGLLKSTDVIIWDFPPIETGFNLQMTPGEKTYPHKTFIKDDQNVFVRDPNLARPTKTLPNAIPKSKDEPRLHLHSSYKDCLGLNLITENTSSYSNIRHPISRFLSSAGPYINNPVNYGGDLSQSYNYRVSKAFDDLFAFATAEADRLMPLLLAKQSDFYGPNTVLWPVEYLNEAASAFITGMGGTVRGEWHLRDRQDTELPTWETTLSSETKNKILEKYPEDLALWETTIQPYKA